ncbi:hypothetical protein B0F90DRAFT_1392097 [Multifurca ochricompacta]|uniref:Uncharacterized protein n=1 Tax=Multifurca ochricompacta TaxID=376703 RepID=A0AAD4QK55_9AGAM|nr:hypothetical protein B0F90DRAFT_1392097 [Multifurca ochricompacta]
MRAFPRELRNLYAVIPQNAILGVDSSSDGNSLVLGPGYEVIGNGQVPQAIPGQAHDGSPPADSSAIGSSSIFASVTPHGSSVAPSSSPSIAPLSSPTGSLTGSDLKPSTSAPPPPSVSISPTGSVLSSSSLSPLGPSPPTSSDYVAITDSPTSALSTSASGAPVSSISAVAPAAAVSNSAGTHGASFWAGIALLGIAGIATLITLFIWWFRVRSRTYRRPWESGWRWGRAESLKFPDEAVSSPGASASWWQPVGDRDVGEPRRSTTNFLSSHGAVKQPHLPELALMSPFTHGPYPTVRPLPLELRHSDTSVPGLMQDVGSLRVANLVAGDILTSGDESSRPPTALDHVGTPLQSSAMLKPRYLSLNGSGLDVPWIVPTPPPEPHSKPPPQLPLPRPPPAPITTTAPLNNNRWKERLERSSERGQIETWRNSLRNNFASALGVLTTGAPLSARARDRSSLAATYDWQTTVPAISRAASMASMASKPWTLEETREGAGIVHFRGVPDSFAPPTTHTSSNSFGITKVLVPTSVGIRAAPLSLSSPLPSPLPSSSLIPPRLPHLPPTPQVPRIGVGGRRTTSTKRQHGSRHRHLSSSSSSMVSSATSVGSDMSRASGSGGALIARWARLSEKEKEARRALRQRRMQSVSTARKRTWEVK